MEGPDEITNGVNPEFAEVPPREQYVDDFPVDNHAEQRKNQRERYEYKKLMREPEPFSKRGRMLRRYLTLHLILERKVKVDAAVIRFCAKRVQEARDLVARRSRKLTGVLSR